MRQEAALTHALGGAVCCRSRSCDEDYHRETGRRFQHRNPRRTSAAEKPQSFQQPGGAWGWSWTSSAEGTGKWSINRKEKQCKPHPSPREMNQRWASFNPIAVTSYAGDQQQITDVRWIFSFCQIYVFKSRYFWWLKVVYREIKPFTITFLFCGFFFYTITYYFGHLDITESQLIWYLGSSIITYWLYVKTEYLASTLRT